jgi:hypothetical protein
VDIDDLIGRERVRGPGILDVGQNHFFAQAGFDQLDDILNTRRKAWRRLGQAIDGCHLPDHASDQTGNCDALLQFNQTPGSRRASHTQYEHSTRFHLHNSPHLGG